MICLPRSPVRTSLPHTDCPICCSSRNIQQHIPDSHVVPTCPPSTAQAPPDKLPGSLPGHFSPAHTVCALAGGEGATVREVLRHKSVEKVVMCDIDQVAGQAGLEPSRVQQDCMTKCMQMCGRCRPMLRQSSSSSSRGDWAGRGSGGGAHHAASFAPSCRSVQKESGQTPELNTLARYLVRTHQPKDDG